MKKTDNDKQITMRGFKYGQDCFIALDPLITYLEKQRAALTGVEMKIARTTLAVISDELRDLKTHIETNYKHLSIAKGEPDESNSN